MSPGPHPHPSLLPQSSNLAANPGPGMGVVMGLDGGAPGSAGVGDGLSSSDNHQRATSDPNFPVRWVTAHGVGSVGAVGSYAL